MSAELTERQRKLRASVLQAASSVDEQLLIVGVLATRLGCSSADVHVVRDALLYGHIRERLDRLESEGER